MVSNGFSVGVGVFVSDYCNFQNDRKELFFKVKKFLQYNLGQFVEDSRS
jgi:hypothetical protein